ncbi:MAG: hypothetical protein HN353_05085 [Bdellovibrionales bacterium]|jgi:hypothetical protein|nr:hypothetical protein [Bdellovibrionales bacterium]MBT3524989.1 hypothetical protein [Bdellovibrionales bacterium]MBT7668157.1 hypothetical protein [Bdellovibrionales bacterium]MBT7767642.1 hypothetical protein [Bdellovibrionales bacterium]
MKITPKKPLRQHSQTVLTLLCSLLITISSATSWAETEQRKHTVSAQAGVYSIGGVSNTTSTDGASMTSLGSFSLDYGYHIRPSYYVSIGYNATIPIIDLSMRALLWGMELGIHYCIFNCITSYEQWSDTLSVTSYNRWGWDVGGGISQRLLNLIQSSRDYSGVFVRTQVYYFFSSSWKVVTGLKMGQLARGDAETITLMELVGGMAYDF